MNLNKTSSTPLLDIGLPVYNDVEFIEESLTSLLLQTFKNFRLIISDDGSTDGSQAICEKYAQKDARISYIRQPKNLGISKNMTYLLNQGNSKYFMWAGDDDLWDKTFIEKLINLLEQNNSISAFCNFSTIDDKGIKLKTYTEFNYSNPNRKLRVVNFIKNSHDAFGYGIFKTKEIQGVKFPIWWWPNKESPYNNIFPTLCYYLTKGNYSHLDGPPLFFKREKTGENVNHILTGKNNAIKESFSFWIRRFNLIIYSSQMIKKSGGIIICIYTFPVLFLYWFILPSLKQFRLATTSFFKNRIKQK